MARGRGGKRTPNQPAAVSGPGALSRRTDGGPGSAKQPIRSFPAESYGQRGQLQALQKAAPMAAGGGGASPAPPPAPAGMGLDGILGPTARPTEPVNAGLGAPQIIPEDPDMLLAEIARRFPHPDITRLRQGR